MENFLEFESDKMFKSVSITLAIFNIIFFFSHIYLIDIINKKKEKIKVGYFQYSFLNILFQLLSSSLFFGILHKLCIENTKFLRISYLIGIALSLEWYIIYMYYYQTIINTLLFLLIPISLLVSVFLSFFFISDFNKLLEEIIKNISFLFYTLMFISPGLNIFKMIKKGNPKYIMIPNSIIGIFCNIAMIVFIISLYRFNSIKFYFIVYPSISILICIFEVVFYFYKINNKTHNLYSEDNSDDIDSDDGNENNINGQKISLVTRDSVEED